MSYNSTSTPTNPLTAPLPPTPNLTPAERATERFSVSGNAIVTGGAGGLGLEAARALLEHGVKGLCIFDIESSFTTARALLQALYAEFPAIKVIEEVVDVADESAVQAAVERTAAALGSVDVLLCFAGIARSAPAVDMSLELWQKVLDINLTGSWLCAKYAAKEMIKQNSGGSIVLVSSVAGYKSLYPLYAPAYSVSKAAVIGLTTNLAAEWGKHGIRVNCVCPGFMETVMTSEPRIQPGIQAYTDRTPLGRIGLPSELTGPIVMFCSPAGRYITGVSILVNESREDNPLTAPLQRNAALSPSEQATARFSVSGNAIVTGGAGDLGRESARALLQHGVKGLCIFDTKEGFSISRVALDAMYAEFPAGAHTFLEEVVDVTDENAIQRAVKNTVENLGSVDILLCFAGIARSQKAEEMTLELWNQVLNINATGSWLCAKAVAKETIRQGTGGSIVLTASVSGHHPAFPVPQAAYSVSKAGIIALTKNLAGEWAEHGIRVNSISPGLIETRLSAHAAWDAVRRPWIERAPLRRAGVPEESGRARGDCGPRGNAL